MLLPVLNNTILILKWVLLKLLYADLVMLQVVRSDGWIWMYIPLHGTQHAPKKGSPARIARDREVLRVMFSRRVFGGSPDSYKILVEFGSPSLDYQQQHAGSAVVRLPVALASLEFEFTSDEAEANIIDRFLQRRDALLQDRVEQRVIVKVTGAPLVGHASRVVVVQLSVTSRTPVLRTIQLYRVNGSGSASESVMQSLLKHCDLGMVWKVKGAEVSESSVSQVEESEGSVPPCGISHYIQGIQCSVPAKCF